MAFGSWTFDSGRVEPIHKSKILHRLQPSGVAIAAMRIVPLAVRVGELLNRRPGIDPSSVFEPHSLNRVKIWKLLKSSGKA